MKKKIIILSIIVLIVCGYFIWWNIGESYPEVDESVFILNDKPLSKEDNLVYTLQGSGWKTVEDAINQHERQVFEDGKLEDIENKYDYSGPFSSYNGIFLLQPMRKYEVQLPEEMWLNKGISLTEESYINSGINMSLRTYFKVMQIPELYQKLSDLKELSGAFQSLKDQDFSMKQDTYDAYYDMMFSGKSLLLSEVGRAMTNIVAYLVMIGKYDQAFEYWQAGYLLGEKLMKGGGLVYSLTGTVIYRLNLSILYFLQEHFGLPEEEKARYRGFLLAHPINIDEIYRGSLLREYWFYKNMFFGLKKGDLKYSSFFLENSPFLRSRIDAEKFLKINKWTKYIDYKRTEEMLRYAYSLELMKFQGWELSAKFENRGGLEFLRGLMGGIVEPPYGIRSFLLKRNIGGANFIIMRGLPLGGNIFEEREKMKEFYDIVVQDLQ